MKSLLILAFGLASSISAALPIDRQGMPEGQTECQLEGWSIDRDPQGLNVRAGPSTDARILGTLPAFVVSDEEHDFGIPVSITASQDGWLRIKDAKDDPARSGLALRETYAGTGWVSGLMIRFGIQSGQGYEKPDASSGKIVDLSDDWLTDFGAIQRVVACSGQWALVDFSINRYRDNDPPALMVSNGSATQRAWFRGICANQETTCDGVGP